MVALSMHTTMRVKTQSMITILGERYDATRTAVEAEAARFRVYRRRTPTPFGTIRVVKAGRAQASALHHRRSASTFNVEIKIRASIAGERPVEGEDMTIRPKSTTSTRGPEAVQALEFSGIADRSGHSTYRVFLENDLTPDSPEFLLH